MRLNKRARSRRLARIASTMGGVGGTDGKGVLPWVSTEVSRLLLMLTCYLSYMFNNIFHTGARAENSTDAHFFQRRNILVGDNAAQDQFHVVQAVGLHQLDHARRKCHVRA